MAAFRIHHALVGGVAPAVAARDDPRRLLPGPVAAGHAAGPHQALVLTANTAHPQYRGELSLEDTAAIIASACGSIGSNRAYLDQLDEQLDLLGIEDDHVRALGDGRREAAKALHETGNRNTMAEVYAP
jgi:cation transport protein ChaC